MTGSRQNEFSQMQTGTFWHSCTTSHANTITIQTDLTLSNYRMALAEPQRGGEEEIRTPLLGLVICPNLHRNSEWGN